MTTRRGSQYSIKSDVGELSSRNDPKKGKRKRKVPSGTQYTQGSGISQRQVLEMPIISELELALSMSHSKRNKSYSEGSNRNRNYPSQTITHSLKRQALINVAPNPPRSDELLAHPQEIFSGGGNSEIL
ncbi:hypothetical protein O181_041215 [Austropuccinia psidii MF-1]|uniref:Uncharacterized protein n=1 Tax=Austropuccinia psidii MF-1 TaxID=1389203 RepID=A0A9Q3DI97_9BASI|nr:hypothetical protein [Austropuccinia psidii MF-1]